MQTVTEFVAEITESMSEVVWLFELADPPRVLYVSPSYERLWGHAPPSELVDIVAWFGAIHPDDRDRLRGLVEQVHALGERREERFRLQRGRETRVLRIAMFPSQGTRIAGRAEDITELVQLEEQVRQAAKLESIGLLAGGVAHDFNNVLAVIGANASMLAETLATADERDLVTEIADAVSRGTGLTRQLLAFSRKEVVEPVVVDLAAAIKDARKMLRRMVGEDIVIETSLDPHAGRVLIDPGYLVQVLMNLAVNARDAMPRGGTLSISTRNTGHGRVVLSIADTGCGMPPEVMARVFEPFFTTKGAGKGTGLGLSVVHGIVQQAGGTIAIDSEPGRGTQILIDLPLVDAPADPAQKLAIAGATGTELVVLVDDDMFIRRATSRALQARGFRVLEAADGNAALRLLEAHDKEVGLLLTDVVMPGIDGPQLASLARIRRPSLKVLYMSGYTDEAVSNHGFVGTSPDPLVEKPFRGHVLADHVRSVIDRC